MLEHLNKIKTVIQSDGKVKEALDLVQDGDKFVFTVNTKEKILEIFLQILSKNSFKNSSNEVLKFSYKFTGEVLMNIVDEINKHLPGSLRYLSRSDNIYYYQYHSYNR